MIHKAENNSKSIAKFVKMVKKLCCLVYAELNIQKVLILKMVQNSLERGTPQRLNECGITFWL